MNLLKDIVQLLQKPFPQEEDWRASLRIIVIVSIFITFFLFVFTPFDMSVAEHNLLLVCIGFGFMTFFGCVIFELFVRITGFKRTGEQFTFGKWLLYMVGTILSISLLNFLFIRLYFFGDIRWEFFIYQVRGTFLIGLFPIVGVGLWNLLRQERKFMKIASDMNEQVSTIPTKQDLESTIFGINISDVRYVEALQNYIKLGYIDDTGQLAEQTIRSTLKEILDSSKHSGLAKSHRSFLVNRNAIVSTSGNAQGLLLTLSGMDRKIPVSRSMVSAFRET